MTAIFKVDDQAAAGAPGLSILLVEDNDADAYVISRALSDNPAIKNVFRSRDGIEAVAMVESGEVMPDLALLDLRMPRMDGLDLLVVFTSLKVDFPMILLTSSTAPADAVRGRLRNAVRVVIKPDTVADMYAVLKTAIEAVCPPGGKVTRGALSNPRYLLAGQATPSLRRADLVDRSDD